MSYTKRDLELGQGELKRLLELLDDMPEGPVGNHLPDAQMNAYLKEELEPAQVEQLDLHLASCEDCARRMEWLLAFRDVFSQEARRRRDARTRMAESAAVVHPVEPIVAWGSDGGDKTDFASSLQYYASLVARSTVRWAWQQARVEVLADAGREEARAEIYASPGVQRPLSIRKREPHGCVPAPKTPGAPWSDILARMSEGLVRELSETARREIRRTALWLGLHVGPKAIEGLVQQVWALASKCLIYGESTARQEVWFASTAAHLARSYFQFSQAMLLQVLEELPASNREILHWRYRDGLSVAEIRLRTGLSVGAVQERLQQSLKKAFDLVVAKREQSREGAFDPMVDEREQSREKVSDPKIDKLALRKCR